MYIGIIYMAVITLNDDNFDQEVTSFDGVVLVDFFATWCGPCKIMAPMIEELAKEYQGQKVNIAKLDIDQSRAIVQKFNIMSVPTFKFFKKGQEVGEHIGTSGKEDFKERIDELLK